MNKRQKQIRNELNRIILDCMIRVVEIKIGTIPENDVERFLQSIIKLKHVRNSL